MVLKEIISIPKAFLYGIATGILSSFVVCILYFAGIITNDPWIKACAALIAALGLIGILESIESMQTLRDLAAVLGVILGTIITQNCIIAIILGIILIIILIKQKQ